ncbi:MAG: hypothetical protein Q8R29_02395 [bacterium]|nr:hypothetical protein [bacterium]
MNLEKIKNLIKKNGDKFILVENDAPEIVMMSFQEYEKLAGSTSKPYSAVTRLPFKAESDISDIEPAETEFVIPLGPAERHPAKPMRLEDISLEDLPL